MFRVALIASALALVASAAGASSTGGPSFALGRTGGNIAPFTVAIAADGSVSAKGPARFSKHRVSVTRLKSLLATAKRERFFSLPRFIRCPKELPDFASRFVTVDNSDATRTVTSHGSCNARFNAVHDALAAAVGLR